MTDRALEEAERTRGILTTDDRKLLMGLEEDLTERAREQRMVRLRRRVRNALRDSQQLHLLPPEERKIIFSPRGEEEEVNAEFYSFMLFKFLYMGIKEKDLHLYVNANEWVQKAIEEAENQLAKEEGIHISPTAELSVNRGHQFSTEKLIKKLRKKDEYLGPKEISAIIQNAELEEEDWERLQEHYNRHVREEPDGYGWGTLREYKKDNPEE